MTKEQIIELGVSDEDTAGKLLSAFEAETAVTANELAGVQAQLEEANKTIDGFKEMDIEAIKKSAEEWKSKCETAQAEADAKMAQMQFDHQLDTAISTIKGKNAKAVKALLDIDSLKNSKNQTEDIKTALETLKAENEYLFEAEATAVPPPYAQNTGTAVVIGNEKTGVEAAFSALNPTLKI